MKRFLLLEDGTVLEGKAFGSLKSTTGELVFTTCMTGYQETITDQSFNGQIVVFTYPLIGNVGINRDDSESIQPSCKGVVVNELARRPSNWRHHLSLDDFLKQRGIPGIAEIDTRALTKRIRANGTLKATFINEGIDLEHALDQLRATVLPTQTVAEVSTKTAYPSPGIGKKIVVMDFGLKHSILRELNKRQCDITVVPYHTSAEEIASMSPDGILLSNGPGNPAALPTVLPVIQTLQQHFPMFGICLGHQLLCLANGAKTEPLSFGHRGGNHPVREIATGDVRFTSQNHQYVVAKDSLRETPLLLTYEHLNDGSVEGVKHQELPVFSVQFHPDAAPGPHDTLTIFDDFMSLIESWKEQTHA